MSLKKGTEIATIDVALVTVKGATSSTEIAITTANKAAVAPATESVDAVKLIVKGTLYAQKPATTTVTGNAITLTDNTFIPELVKMLQGGTIKYWTDATKTTSGIEVTTFGVAEYAPPVLGATGADSKGEIFETALYSAIYNAAGIITGYEKTVYPNCQGVPVAFNTEDGAFRAPEYTINSAPDTGEAPYVISYVKELPTVA